MESNGSFATRALALTGKHFLTESDSLSPGVSATRFPTGTQTITAAAHNAPLFLEQSTAGESACSSSRDHGATVDRRRRCSRKNIGGFPSPEEAGKAY